MPKKINKPDSYYYDIINNSKSIADSSKQFYLKKLQIIINEICTTTKKLKNGDIAVKTLTISKIIVDPDTFRIKLEAYKTKNDAPLGMHSKDGYVASIKALFNHDTKLMNDHRELFEKWDELHKLIRVPIENKYLSNEPDEKQKKAFVAYDNIVKIREAIPSDVKNTQNRLLLFMYTEIPPARADYDKLKVLKEAPAELKGNFIIFNNKNNSKIVLNDYKTKHKHQTIEIDIPDILYEEIKKSLAVLPRQYVFVGKNKEPFSNTNTYVKWANRALKKILNNEYVSLSTLRHIYISRRDLRLEEKSGLEQKKIADIMGHGLAMQKRYNWHAWADINAPVDATI